MTHLHPKLILYYLENLLKAAKQVKLCSVEDLAVYQSIVFESRKTGIFKCLRKVKSGARLHSVIRNGSAEAESPLQKARLFNDYFRSLINSKGKWPLIPVSALRHSMEADFDNRPDKIEVFLSGLDPSKATGPDGMPNHLLNSCFQILSKSNSVVCKQSKQSALLPPNGKWQESSQSSEMGRRFQLLTTSL